MRRWLTTTRGGYHLIAFAIFLPAMIGWKWLVSFVGHTFGAVALIAFAVPALCVMHVLTRGSHDR